MTKTETFTIPEPFNQRFKVTVRVTQDGQFTTQLPDDIVELFRQREVNLGTNRMGKPGHFSADTLNGLNQDIRDMLTVLCSEKVVKREKLIRFAIRTTCAYACHKDTGEFIPNASDADEQYWRGGTYKVHSNQHHNYGFEIWAEVVTRVDYKYEFSERTRTEYVAYKAASHLGSGDPDNPAEFLSKLCGQVGAKGFGLNEVQEIPYTDEAAWFFVNLYKSLFALNERILPYVKKDRIHELIEASQGRKLLGG